MMAFYALRALPYFLWLAIKEAFGSLKSRFAPKPGESEKAILPVEKGDQDKPSSESIAKAGSNANPELTDIAAVEKAEEADSEVITRPAKNKKAGPSKKAKASKPKKKADMSGNKTKPKAKKAKKAKAEISASARPSVVETGEPAVSTVHESAGSDDLRRVKGIGAALEEELKSVGVDSYEKLSRLTIEDLGEARMRLTIMQRAAKDDWAGQAARLAAGEVTEFAARVDAGKVPSSSEGKPANGKKGKTSEDDR